MQFVSSGAVYEAFGGSKIKKFNYTVSLSPNDNNYGYIQFGSPADMILNGYADNCNVISCQVCTQGIASSQGTLIDLRYALNGTGYFCYMKPANITENVTFYITIWYVV